MDAVIPISQRRLRLRNTKLKDATLVKELSEYLGPFQGVLSIANNIRVGSILIIFNAEETNAEEIIKHLSTFQNFDHQNWLPQKQKAKQNARNRAMKKFVKMGLVAGAIGTLGTLTVSKKMHVLAGSLFFSLLSAHLYQNRRTLLK